MSKIFDSSLQTMERALDLYLQRHALISDNIANAETPNFKARRMDFEAELQRAVEFEQQGIAGRSIASVSGNTYEDYDSELGQDLNTVDMDKEMASLTKNELKYNAATEMVSRKFALLKYAITGGN